MEDYIKKLIYLLNEEKELSDSFDNYSKFYLNSTENIAGYTDSLDVFNKCVLTVAGSYDQALNMYANGASDVVCFDSNMSTNIVAALKRAAIIALTPEEYLNFFSTDSIYLFNKLLYNKMKKHLPNEYIYLFNYLYKTFNISNMYKVLCHDFSYPKEKLRKFNTFLDDENYMYLSKRMRLNDTNIINASITSLPDIIKEDYFDLLLLSNICDYIHNIYPDNTFNNYRKLLISILKKMKEGALIQYEYVYSKSISDITEYSKTNEREYFLSGLDTYSIDIQAYDTSYIKLNKRPEHFDTVSFLRK